LNSIFQALSGFPAALGRPLLATPATTTSSILSSAPVLESASTDALLEPAFSATDTSFNNTLFGDPSPTPVPSSLFQDDFAPEFGSRAANSEYAVLSSMLNGSMSHPPDTSTSSYDFLNTGTTVDSPFFSTAPPTLPTLSFEQLSLPILPGSPIPSPSTDATSLDKAFPPSSHTSNSNSGLSYQISLDHEVAAGSYRTASGAMRAEDVYRHINKPYPYAQQYHVLIKHLKERFEKNDILRVVRALAVFRPSLIALQMPLTEEDEVFAEKCFQRTLIVRSRVRSLR
jgi:hypothetical protein